MRIPEIGPTDAYPAEEAEQPLDLRGYLQLLRRRWWLLAIAGAVGLAAGWAWDRSQIPQYTAEALLEYTQSSSPLSALGLGMADQSGSGVASQLEIARSRAVLAPVVDSLGLRVAIADRPRSSVLAAASVSAAASPQQLLLKREGQRVELVEPTTDSVVAAGAPGEWLQGAGVRLLPERKADLSTPAEIVILPGEAAFQRLRGQIAVAPVENTGLLRIRYSSPDPRFAARVANQVARSYQRYSTAQAREEAVRRREFIAEQLANVADSVAAKQRVLQEYQERSELLDPTVVGPATVGALTTVEGELRALRFQKSILSTVLASLRTGSESDAAFQRLVALGDETLPGASEIYGRLRQLQTERERLTASRFGYTSNGPGVEVLDSLIASARAEMQVAAVQASKLLDQRIAEAQSRVGQLSATVDALPARAGVFSRLKQQVDAAQSVFDMLAGKYYEAQIAEAVASGNVKIVDAAPIPLQPNPGGGPRTLIFSLLVGLMLGGGGALLLERLDTSIRQKDDLEGQLRVPGLAVIPQIAARVPVQRRLWLPLSGIRGGQNGNGNGNGHPGLATGLRELVTVSDLRSSGSEAYRTLRTNLIFSQAVRSLKTLVVASSAPAEGKTTTAANLAVAFAQQGMRVLVVDCDLRRARLHQVFGVPREPGLTQLVLGHAKAEEAVRGTAVEGLFVLPSGTLPPNPSELLGSPGMQEVLAALREEFDLVVLDTPPLLAASDAAVLGRLADGVLLVVRAGHTDRRAAQQALEQLHTVGARVVGAVLNDPDAKVPSYGGYYHYGNYGVETESA